MKTGKHEAQTMGEMVEDMNEAKAKSLAPSARGQTIYKKESGEYQEEKLKDLVSMNLRELAEFATKEKVRLDNLEEVQRRTIYYMRACEETGTFPSALGLARSLGYSDRALRYWRSRHPESEIAQWLEMFNDMCADILSQSALKNNANNIMAIFLNKALYEMRETSELVITPHVQEEELRPTADEIRRRYLMDEYSDND